MLRILSPRRLSEKSEVKSLSPVVNSDDIVPEYVVKESVSHSSDESSSTSDSSELNGSASENVRFDQNNMRFYQRKRNDHETKLRNRIASLESKWKQTKRQLKDAGAANRELSLRCTALAAQIEARRDDKSIIRKLRNRIASITEIRAQTEQELMNELSKLSRTLIEQERMYKMELLERDKKIADLEECISAEKSENHDGLLEGPSKDTEKVDSGNPRCSDEVTSVPTKHLLELQMQASRVSDLESQLEECQGALQSLLRRRTRVPTAHEYGEVGEDTEFLQHRKELLDDEAEEEEFMNQLESLELDMSADLMELQTKLESDRIDDVTSDVYE